MRFLSVLLCCSLFVGCGDDDVPPPPLRDGGTGTDASALDASTGGDASPGDAGADDAGGGDAGSEDASEPFDAGTDAGLSFDAGSFDGGTYTFGADCEDAEGGFDLCLCDVPECDPDATPSCAAGLRCLPDGCGRTTCQLGGHACVANDDCAEGSICFGTGTLDGSAADLCLRPSAGCADSRDCAPGYACEEGTCVDRRVRCEAPTDCPYGFFCNDADSWALPYCMRVSRRCSSFAGACPPFFSCVDVDGDGLSECRRNGEACDTNDDCGAAGEVCGYDPVAKALACQAHGPCASAEDCADGFGCVDVWGDGVRECVPSGGECERSASCPTGALCGAPSSGGGAMCTDSAGP